MNFTIVDGVRPAYEEIHDDFIQDYIFSTDLKNNEIRLKYGLSHKEFKELSDMVKEEFGVSRRPIRITGCKYYYKHKHGFHIQKTIDNVVYYLGYVTSEDVAIEIVEKCKNVSWNIGECRQIVKEYGGVCV